MWNLFRGHREIWIPPRKELHYFDRHPGYPSTNLLSESSFKARLLGASSINIQWKREAIRDVLGSVGKGDIERIKWCYEFYSKDVNDEWYLDLFEKRAENVVGEITPAYSFLDKSDVEHVRKLMPDVKIIFLIRNPVDRDWSHIRFDAGLGKINDINDLSEVKRYLESSVVTLRGDYLRTLDIWESVFHKSQFFIGFYDEICMQPNVFLGKLAEFLGVDASLFPQQRVAANIGVSQSQEIPAELAKFIASRHIENLRRLKSMLGPPVDEWFKSTGMILEK